MIPQLYSTRKRRTRLSWAFSVPAIEASRMAKKSRPRLSPQTAAIHGLKSGGRALLDLDARSEQLTKQAP